MTRLPRSLPTELHARHGLRCASHIFGLLIMVALSSCATSPFTRTIAPPTAPNYAVLEAQARAGDFSQLAQLRTAWLHLPDAAMRIQKVTEFEAQALQMLDQPLRLGAIGNAILELYPASLLGHTAMASFYERVTQAADAAKERAAVKAIADALRTSGDGTAAAPYAAIATSDATAFLRNEGLVPLGSIYSETAHGQLLLNLLVSRGAGQALRTIIFDVTPTFTRLQQVRTSADGKPASVPFLLIEMAQHGDSGAQTTAATQLMREEATHQARAFQLLQRAVTDGNLYARLALAQGYLNAYNAEPDSEQRRELLNRAIEQLEQGVLAGSDVAMLELGRVYVSGYAGKDKTAQGVALIQRAVDLQHPSAMLLLARLYQNGDGVSKDPARVQALVLQAAQLDLDEAKLAYAQLQLAATPATLDEQARTWLEQLARANQPNAMLLLAGCQVRGVHVRKDIRAAKKLYAAVADNPAKNPEFINDVVWTYSVTDEPQLRDGRTALKLMDAMMSSNQEASKNAAYLDTWAAAHAANGQFARAIELQEQAIKAAKDDQGKDELPEDVVKSLTEHLAAFQRGEALTEKVP